MERNRYCHKGGPRNYWPAPLHQAKEWRSPARKKTVQENMQGEPTTELPFFIGIRGAYSPSIEESWDKACTFVPPTVGKS